MGVFKEKQRAKRARSGAWFVVVGLGQIFCGCWAYSLHFPTGGILLALSGALLVVAGIARIAANRAKPERNDR
jgi:uncharacterized membrane protein HdeD (DUF308 family)